jgi:hypothetical protein
MFILQVLCKTTDIRQTLRDELRNGIKREAVLETRLNINSQENINLLNNLQTAISNLDITFRRQEEQRSFLGGGWSELQKMAKDFTKQPSQFRISTNPFQPEFLTIACAFIGATLTILWIVSLGFVIMAPVKGDSITLSRIHDYAIAIQC